jgi:hypothetical protein
MEDGDSLVGNIPPPKPTEQQAESILKLLLANLDRGDVRSIAQQLLSEYTKHCLTALDCEELHSALRRLFLSRYSELQLALHRMDKLGLLLRRIQYLADQGALDTGLQRPHHQHDGRHRRDYHHFPGQKHHQMLKRIDREDGKSLRDMRWKRDD